jgi:DNA repair protein RecO (recombination protein O)
MNIYSAEATILRHIDYGESDRIVTFFTAEHGRQKGFARGARNSRKRFGAALEPFAAVRLFWSNPKSGELLALREADLLDLRVGLRDNLSAIALAAYGCELVEELFGEGHAYPQVFALLGAFLDHLAAGGRADESRMLFELRILKMSGYVPHLLHCSLCMETLTGTEAFFAITRGGSLCPHCAAGGGTRIAVLTLGSLARSLLTPTTLFAGFRLSPQTIAEGCALLDETLREHLQRPLRSLPFLEQVTMMRNHNERPC